MQACLVRAWIEVHDPQPLCRSRSVVLGICGRPTKVGSASGLRSVACGEVVDVAVPVADLYEPVITRAATGAARTRARGGTATDGQTANRCRRSEGVPAASSTQ